MTYFKRDFIALAVALSFVGVMVAGCSPQLQTAPNVVAKVATATPTVVADLAAAGALAGAIAQQIAAANPNNAKIVAATTKLQAGVAITNADAAALAPAVVLVNGAVQVVAATAK